MPKGIQNKKFIALPSHPSLLQLQYKTENLGIQRKYTNLNHKEILSVKLQEGLLQITSPYLKKNISNMFSHKKIRQLQPIMQEISSKEKNRIHAEIGKNISQSMKIESNSHLKGRERKSKQIKVETKMQNSEHLIPSKALKNYNLSRNHDYYLDFGLIDLKKSLQMRQKIRRKSKQNSRKNSRALTQQSQHSQQTSKVIFKKLQLLNQKQSHVSYSASEKQSLFFKPFNKEPKSSGFVMRQKFSKEMYGQQRQQLKLVNEILENEKGINLSKGIKVKNYTKFFPNIMSIQG